MSRQHKNKISSQQGSAKPFAYADYTNVKQALTKALHGPFFYGQLTANSGMGKTSLLREVQYTFEHHEQSHFHMLYIPAARVSVIGIVHFLAQRLHVGSRRSYFETVQALAEAIQAQGQHVVLWLDDADQLQTDTLQEIRMLAEVELTSTQLLTVFFAGLPSFHARLDSALLFPLKRRIRYRFSLSGLQRNETQPFLLHRFGAQSSKRIPENIQSEIFERTSGTPALIELIARELLERTNTTISLETCHEALERFGI